MADDVLTLLLQDHQEAEAMLGRFDATPTTGRAAYFAEVARILVGHEVAEEMIVYPALRQESDEAADVTTQRLDEQAEAEQVLADLEKLDPESEEFAEGFRQLRESVLAHAQAEEATAFPLLEQGTSADERRELGQRYRKAKETAPTHPHPHAPDTPPGNQVLGPVAALFDRARDAVRSA